MNKLIYTVTEAAYLLNCSAAKVYKLIKAGKLPYGKNGHAYILYLEDIRNYARSSITR